MDWADRRRFFIALAVLAVLGAVVAGVLIATLYEAPSCRDGKENQGETGVDCGGPCALLCRADMQPPTVLFTQALSGGVGRTDIVSSIENKNGNAAAKRVPYTVLLYSTDQSLIGKTEGVLDLPPAAAVPIFIPGVASGTTTARAFLTIDPDAVTWYRVTGKQPLPTVSGITIGGSAQAPRIQATLSNNATVSLKNVGAVVLVHGKGGNVIAASSTILPEVPGQGSAIATFTWNRAFSEVPLSVEVVPVLPLP